MDLEYFVYTSIILFRTWNFPRNTLLTTWQHALQFDISHLVTTSTSLQSTTGRLPPTYSKPLLLLPLWNKSICAALRCVFLYLLQSPNLPPSLVLNNQHSTLQQSDWLVCWRLAFSLPRMNASLRSLFAVPDISAQ